MPDRPRSVRGQRLVERGTQINVIHGARPLVEPRATDPALVAEISVDHRGRHGSETPPEGIEHAIGRGLGRVGEQKAEHEDGAAELYDPEADPLQAIDLLADPETAEASAAIVDDLTSATAELRDRGIARSRRPKTAGASRGARR